VRRVLEPYPDMQVRKLTLALICTLLAGAAEGMAQTPPPGTPPRPVPEPKLSFDREIFSYPGDGRRDPFKPLSGTDAMGPLYEDLTLKGIIYSRDPALSIATVTDGTKKMYRVRRGDVIGNARVAEIQPRLVKWQVQSYGMIREEVMPLAVRAPAAEMQAGGQDNQAIERLLQQEFLRALQGARLDTARRAPRRDTGTTAIQPR
jgi:hypothetical protein